MPKYCSVPNCRSDPGNSGERKSFYKFPLQEPVRLRQWLRNMGREDWTPSRHQYVCHEHFAPACFKVRWGIRYLDTDAVPTVFPEAEKRRAMDDGERKLKRPKAGKTQRLTASDGRTTASGVQSELQTMRLLEFAIKPSPHGGTCLTDSQVSADGAEAGVTFPLTFYQTVDDLMSSGATTEVLTMSETSAEDGQVELNRIAAAVLSQGGVLVLNEPEPGCAQQLPGVQDLAAADFPQAPESREVVAYFETVPSVFPSGALTQFTSPPDTVLSSALSPKPIPSTLPIVSKHAPPPPLALTLERLDRDEGDEGDGVSDADESEQEGPQLEEHCYHKNSLSKEQLEAIVAELQKKVKVLQQRHRRHLEKLLGLENTVSQLRQSNTLNEERLQLLERAYLQTSAAVSDAGETVAIIYEEDDAAAYFYTPLNDAGTPSNVDAK